MLKRVLISLAIVAGLLGPPAQASVTEQRIVAELREQGYARIEIRRTLLGRTRIRATSPSYEREIILNPATGVIIRDFWRSRNDNGGSGPGTGQTLRGSDGSGAGTFDGAARGSGRGSGRDDDDDDDGGGGGSSGGGNDNDNDNDDDDDD